MSQTVKIMLILAAGVALVAWGMTLLARESNSSAERLCHARWADSGLQVRWQAYTCQVRVRSAWVPEGSIKVPAGAAQ